LPAQALDLHIMNVQTDRIFLGTSGGLLQCLRETNSHYPVVHFGEIKKKKAPPVLKPGQKPTEPADAGGGKPADPFSAPAGQDPFAAPGAAAPKGAKPAPGAAADPFAPAAAPAPAPGADPFKAP
jgi:hypothetical protein